MASTKMNLCASIVAFGLVVCASAAPAATLFVATTGNDANPGTQAQPFRTIAHGIAAAVNGDTVQVAAGTYAENLSSDKDLILQGAGAGQSIIDGGGATSCLILYGVPSTARVAGFTFQNGKASGNVGAGLTNSSGGSPVISDCTFTSHISNGGQLTGVIQMNDGTPTLQRCTIANNSVGAFMGISGTLSATDCVVTDNVGVVYGGAAYLRAVTGNTVYATYSRCRFQRNKSLNGALNSQIYGENADITLLDCLLVTDSASGNPTAVEMRPAFVYLYSSTVAGANAVPLIRSNSGNNYLEVRNGIIWGTDPQKDVIGSTARTVAYTDLMNANLAGAGNINTDPKFVNPANGDYRLQASSPCINTAGPEHIAATDLDGAPRVQGGTLDMGAYEFWVAASGNWFVDKALGNDITGTGAPGNPYKTVVKAISSASNGHRIYTKAGNYGTDRPRITKNLKFYNWKATGRASIGKP